MGTQTATPQPLATIPAARAPAHVRPHAAPPRGIRRGGAPVPRRRILIGIALVALLALGTFAVPGPTAASEPVPIWFHHDHTIQITNLRIGIDITNDIANTTFSLDITQQNATRGEAPGDHDDVALRSTEPRELVVDLPLPHSATLTAFALHVEGEQWYGEVQERNEARRTYEDAKERGEDAILLERADDDGVRVAIFVPWGAQRTLDISYIEAVPLEQGARTYRLGTSALAQLPSALERLSIDLILHSPQGFSAFTTPGLALETTADTGTRLRGTYQATHDRPSEDLVVTWTESHGSWGRHLQSDHDTHTAYRHPSGNDTLVASFVYAPDEAATTLPRDLVFVLDHSGSMSGSKMVQARDSVREVLLSLRPDDRFAIVAFDDDISRITPGLVPADTDHIQTARQNLQHIDAHGSTNLDGGLQAALAMLNEATQSSERARVPLVVLLTDGQPTSGYTEPQGIVNRMIAANTMHASVHVLAIGLDADDTFLEDVVLETGGRLTIVEPDDTLQAQLEGFYATLEDPILTQVEIVVVHPPSSDMLPRTLPAVYRDGTIRVSFLADLGPENTSQPPIMLQLTGTSSEGRITKNFTFLRDEITPQPLAGLLWGRQHVDELLSRHRAGDETASRADIITAAKHYGIATPHTSWVIVKPQPATEPPDDGSAQATQRAPQPGAPGLAAEAADHAAADDDTAFYDGAIAPRSSPSGSDEPSQSQDPDDDSAATPGFTLPLVLVSVAIAISLARRHSRASASRIKNERSQPRKPGSTKRQ